MVVYRFVIFGPWKVFRFLSAYAKADLIMTEVAKETFRKGLQNNKNILKKQNGVERDEEGDKIRNKWKTTSKQAIESQRSWKLIDGSVEDISWSSADDCWKWIKRFLTLGNIGVIAVCFCLLLGTTFVCFSR